MKRSKQILTREPNHLQRLLVTLIAISAVFVMIYLMGMLLGAMK